MDARTYAKYRDAYLSAYPVTVTERSARLKVWEDFANRRRLDPAAPSKAGTAAFLTWLTDSSSEVTGKPRAVGSVGKFISVVRAFHKFIDESGGPATGGAFAALPTPARSVHLRRPVEEDVHQRMMLSAAEERPANRDAYRAMLALMRDGVLLGTVGRADVDWLNLKDSVLIVPPTGRPKFTREYALTPPSIAAIGAHFKTREQVKRFAPLLVTSIGTRIGTPDLRDAVRRIALRAEVRRFDVRDYARPGAPYTTS